MQRRVCQDRIEGVPRVLIHLILQEVVQAAYITELVENDTMVHVHIPTRTVARNLELWSDTQSCAGFLGLDDTLLDPLQVTSEVQAPLVQCTCCEGNQRRHFRYETKTRRRSGQKL